MRRWESAVRVCSATWRKRGRPGLAKTPSCAPSPAPAPWPAGAMALLEGGAARHRFSMLLLDEGACRFVAC